MSKNIKQRDYSRTEMVFGKEALHRMQKSHYLILGLGGVGFEVCKDIILTGASKITVYDPLPVKWADLSANGFLNERMIGQRRDEAQGTRYSELNTQCKYSILKNSAAVFNCLDHESISCVVITESELMYIDAKDILEICHAKKINVVLSTAAGLSGRVFSDFGKDFIVTDPDGEKIDDISLQGFTADNISGKIHYYLTAVRTHELPEDCVVNVRDILFSSATHPEIAEQLTKLFNDVEFNAKATSSTMVEIIPSEKTNPELVEYLNKVFVPETIFDCPVYYERGGYIKRIKQPVTISFKSYNETLSSPTFPDEMIDYSKMGRNPILHCLFSSQNKSISEDQISVESTSSLVNTLERFEEFYASVRSFSTKYNVDLYGASWDDKEIREIAAQYFVSRDGILSPVCSIVGAWGAQEALKSVSGKYMPIQQYFYFDCFETLKVNESASKCVEALVEAKPCENYAAEFKCVGDRYDGLRSIFGETTLREIHNVSLFMIGAGALGCELLKNFALCGVATNDNTTVTVTDPDTIENSNLSRQFLFRDSNIGQSKSQAACDRISEMNPEMHTTPLQLKVCPETEDKFNRSFFTSNTLVVNALDNVKSRRYVDGKCVEYCLPLLESGTMGQKANSQVVIPRMTETYSAQIDSEEGDIPQCTIHNFPNNLTHCIVYANSDFAGIFSKSASDLSLMLKGEAKQIASSMVADDSSVRGRLFGLAELCSVGPIKTIKDALKWATLMFFRNFGTNVAYILECFPLNAKDKDGFPFWSAAKRPPHELTFINKDNKLHRTFIESAAKLISVVWGVPKYSEMDFSDFCEDSTVIEEINHIINEYQYDESFIQAVKTNANRITKEKYNKYIDSYLEELRFSNPNATQQENLERFVMSICPYTDKTANITSFELEKDDPENAHIDYVGAFANLRAENYDIPQAPIEEVRRIAGNIIPAMITTTALIVGYVGIEFFKAMTYKRNIFKIEDYKSIFMNFALPLTVITEPGEYHPKKISTTGEPLTEWDSISIDLRENTDNRNSYTVQDMKDMIEERYKCEVDMFVSGTCMFYSQFSEDADTVLEEKLYNIIDKQILSELDENAKKNIDDLTITVGAYNPDDDEEVELPVIRVTLY